MIRKLLLLQMLLSRYAVVLASQIYYIPIRAGTLRALFHQVLQAFGIHKTRTTAYHQQGDGMVERFNCSLLQFSWCYVESEDDWECYLLSLLYAYCTAQHSSTGASPFQLMFERPSQSSPFCQPTAFDPNTYSAQLQAKLAASLQDFVHTNISASAQQQKIHHDKHSHVRSFVAGAPVWLPIKVKHVDIYKCCIIDYFYIHQAMDVVVLA